MKHTRRRQVLTTCVLVLLIAACITGGTLLRRTRIGRPAAPVQTPQPVAALQSEQEEALALYRAHTQSAQTQTAARDSAQKAELLFYGACTGAEARTLMSLLRASGAEASFFLTQSEAASAQELVAVAKESGCTVGIVNAGSAESIASAQPETVVRQLTSAGTAMQSACGIRPSAMLMLGELNEEIPYAAYAAGIDRLYVPTLQADAADFSTREKAEALIDSLNRGTLLAVRLSGGQSLQAIGYLLAALEESDLDVQVNRLLGANPAPAVPVQKLHTIERAVSFVFSGMGSEAELRGVLSALDAVQGTGMFFLTREELESQAQAIALIRGAGHEVGLATLGQGTASDLLRELLEGREAYADCLGSAQTPAVLCTLGSPAQALLTAAAAGGFTVVAADSTLTQPEDVWQTDAAAIAERVRPESWGPLQRGEIAHFKLGFYQNDDGLLSELVSIFATERCCYAIRPATALAANTAMLYTYPVPEDKILPAVKDKIYPGQLLDNSFEAICPRYYGVDWVDRASFLPGFTGSEIRKLDKKGIIPDADNRIFLTFDDWGTDEAITNLLDVLAKHNAKATFFVRTSFVQNNPNLLRAIAAEGHAIGSHTDSHFPLANLEGKTYKELTEEQIPELQADVVTSYQKLQSIVGDMETDGTPILCRVFRPPTLAMSRNGLEAILDCGFTYSLAGSYSAMDYNAKSAQSIVNAMRWRTKSGAVFVMHMSDNSAFTAEAVDLYLTYVEKELGGKYRFCRITDVL